MPVTFGIMTVNGARRTTISVPDPVVRALARLQAKPLAATAFVAAAPIGSIEPVGPTVSLAANPLIARQPTTNKVPKIA